MNRRGLSQETLKSIACITMLIDHIGALFVPGYALRCIGRLAFPIYCFLLAEGVHHTRNAGRYGLRLLFAALISELPFDLAVYGRTIWKHQNVMVTLLLGFCALQLMKRCPNIVLKIMAAVPFALLADFLYVEYGAQGVMLIALFGLTREMPYSRLLQLLGMLFLFERIPSPQLFRAGSFYLSLQSLGAFSILPIALYNGRKVTGSKLVQWGFYLFYPVHLLVLYLFKWT